MPASWLILVTLLCLPARLWGRTPPPIPEEVPVVSWPTPEVYALSDGTPVWMVPRPGTPLVRVEVSLRQGYLGLAQPEAGLLAGAVARTDSGEALAAVGGEVSVGAGAERVWASVEVLRGGEAVGVAALASALRAPVLERRAVVAQRRAWARERQGTARRVGGVHALALSRLLFPDDHPLGLRPTARDWRRLSVGRVREAWAELLHSGAAAVVVVGDTSAEVVLPLLEAHLAGQVGGTAAPLRFSAPTWPAAGPVVVVVDVPGASQARITHTRPAPGRGEAGLAEAEVAVRVLGGDFTSRLSMQVREEEGLVYEISGELWARPGLGRLEVSCVAAVEDVGRTVAAITAVMEGMAERPPTEVEVAAALRAAALERARARERLETLARPYGQALLHGEAVGDGEGLAVEVEAVAEASRLLLGTPQGLWVITGDAELVEVALGEAGWRVDRRLDGRGVADGRGW